MTFEFEYRNNETKYSTRCPKCADERDKQGTKSLMVYNDKDGVRYECLHPGCVWNERQFKRVQQDIRKDDSGLDRAGLLLDVKDLPRTIGGDRVSYYRDTEGRPLYGVKRTDKADGSKFFTPVTQHSGKIVYGKMAKYPQVKALYGAEDLKDKDLVIVVEGEKAKDRGKEIFTKAAVVTWRGGTNNTSQGDWDLLDGKDVFLWPDNDPEGKTCMEKIAKRLKGARRIRLAHTEHLPHKADIGDPLSREVVMKAFRDAKDITNVVTGRLSFEELKSQNEKLNVRISFGWDIVDNEVQLPQSGVVVLEARTKHGKSAFAVNLTRNMLYAGQRVKFFSYEIPASRVIARYARSENPALSFEEVYDSSEILPYKSWLNEHLVVYDQSKQYSIDDLIAELDSDTNNGACIVVDYCQIVPLANKDRHIATKELVDRLRIVAHTRGFLVLLLSQLTKNASDPMQDTPRYAQDLHFGAEMVIRLWNKEHEPPHPVYESTPGNFICHILYNRDGPAGMRFGFDFEKGSRLTPNGEVDKEYSFRGKRDHKSDILQLADVLREGLKLGDF